MHTRNRYPHPGRPKTSINPVPLRTVIEEHAKVKMKRDKGSLSDGQYITHLIESAGNEMRIIAQQAAELNEFRKIHPKLKEKIALYENNLTESDRATDELRMGAWKEIRSEWKMKLDWKGFKAISLERIQIQLKTKNKQETTKWINPKLRELQEELEKEYEQLREKEKQQPLNPNEWWFLHKKEILEAYQKRTPRNSPIYKEAEEKSGYRWEDIDTYCRTGTYTPWTPENLREIEKNYEYAKNQKKIKNKQKEIIQQVIARTLKIDDLPNPMLDEIELNADDFALTLKNELTNRIKNNTIKIDEIPDDILKTIGKTKEELVNKQQEYYRVDLRSRFVKGGFSSLVEFRKSLSAEELRKTGLTEEQFIFWLEKSGVRKEEH